MYLVGLNDKLHLRFNRDMIERDFLTATFAIKKRGLKKKKDGTFCTQCLKSACLVFILKMTFLNYLNAQWQSHRFVVLVSVMSRNVKCEKEYFTLNVSNIVLVIFKSFITFCWEKKRIKKNRILNRNRNILVKNRNSIILLNRLDRVCVIISI